MSKLSITYTHKTSSPVKKPVPPADAKPSKTIGASIELKMDDLKANKEGGNEQDYENTVFIGEYI